MELEALEVRDRQFLAPQYLNSFSVRYLRGAHSPPLISAYVRLGLPAADARSLASGCTRVNSKRSS